MASTLRLLRGASIGRFRVIDEIGRGSSATVYAVHDELTGQELALKWIAETIDVAALKREFRIARALSHPNLINLHELHVDSSGAFFTMERLGGDIVSRCAREHDARARTRLVRQLFAELADALAYLHAAAFVHRDIKPANVLLGAGDRVVLLDLGLAQPASSVRSAFAGTLAYAAPERMRGGVGTPASDWFSFGVVLFEALAGTLPFGPDPRATAQAWLHGRRVDVRARLPPEAMELAGLLEQLLDPHVERRANASIVADALDCARRWADDRAMIGRAMAREWLGERIERRVRLGAVVGDAGTGKTALVRSVLDTHRELRLVLASRCHPREHVPFNALDGVVLDLLERVRQMRPALDDDARLLESAFDSSRAAPEGATPVAIAGALVRTLQLVAAGRRIIIWIDDVQWADRDSIPLLEHIAQSAELDLICVLIARGEIDDIPVTLRPRASDVLSLAPLDEADSLTLLRRLVPGVEVERARALAVRAAGRPLVLEQIAAWALAGHDRVPETFPELMVQMAEERSPSVRDVLCALALHERELEVDVVLAYHPASSTYELLDAGLVQFERSAARYTVRMRHEQIAVSLAASLGDEARRAHHLRLADAFEKARPGDADAMFQHLVAAGEIARARIAGRDAARSYRSALAFHRAAERLRWLLANASEPAEASMCRHELADVLARAGEAVESGEMYLNLAQTAAPAARDELMRSASEQFLRGGDVARGTATLDECLRANGMTIPTARSAQLGRWLVGRLAIRRALAERPRARSAPDPVSAARIELAWSAGLGLNLVDLMRSTVAQTHFTELALHKGSDDQVARACAVEYSYAMLAGGSLASSRGELLRGRLENLRDTSSSYARGIIDLSWAAGDFFRGAMEGTKPRFENARREFESSLGAKSWELANCGMYESWAALERGELERMSQRVPELLRFGTSRGDATYRHCLVGGYSSTAWLIADRADELDELLDSLPTPPGPFHPPHLLALIARVRAALYRGRPIEAWERVRAAWPEVVKSGLLALRWMRYALGVLFSQAAVAARGEPGAAAFARVSLALVARIDHPAALPWSTALSAVLLEDVRSRASTLADLARAEDAFAQSGHRLAAQLVRHRRATMRDGPDAAWSTSVRDPDALARGIGLPATRVPAVR